QCLIEALGVASERARPLRYFVTVGAEAWGQAQGGALWDRFAGDLERWEKLVARIRAFNARVDGAEPSLYRLTPKNPLALVPLRWLWRQAGISQAFWDRIFVSVHSASFLTTRLDDLPAFIAPALEDIVSLRHGGDLETWSTTSADVFAAIGRDLELRLDAEVATIRRDAGITVELRDGTNLQADHLVFACPARAALSMLAKPHRREKLLLRGVRYTDDRDPTFATGIIHRDAGVLPEAHRATILRDYANHVHCDPDERGHRYSNTFVLSSWVPTARDARHPMLVSYHTTARPNAAEVEGEVDNRLAHPELTTDNLARAMALRFVQGTSSTYYCGSWTTPGNGHDLSALSGLVVAAAVGAPYPFTHPPARRDFDALSRFMLGSSR
ncbi:MAG: FAD-dependent oxidoreductase, partial [Myxococcales bacterium]|nr:FAD-dependent oxidoreductase [Myxococcales bacterium]